MMHGSSYSEYLWTWHYRDGSYHVIQGFAHSSNELLESIQDSWYDDGAENWIAFDSTRVATVYSKTSIQIGG